MQSGGKKPALFNESRKCDGDGLRAPERPSRIRPGVLPGPRFGSPVAHAQLPRSIDRMTRDLSWPERYGALIERLPDLARNARLTMGGFSACVDVYLSLHDAVAPLREAAANTPAAAAMLDELERRALNGIGGELAVDWPEGPAWIDRHVSGRRGIGGTGVQAAYMLAMLGAPALVALEDRSAEQLAVIHPDTLIANERGALPRSSIKAEGRAKPPHYIFEYTAGETIGGKRVPRSSRTIVRFDHSALEHDPHFVRLSKSLAATVAGAGIICGFNELPPEHAAAEIDYAASVADAWRRKGLALVHMELGDFPDPRMRALTIERLMPAVTSVGMSLSELVGLTESGVPPDFSAMRLAESFGLDRVCIHADEWAFAVTRGDPERELQALEAGCLLASARAAEGYFSVPEHLPDSARFTIPPLPVSLQRDGWSIVCCPAPYLEKPAATIGLGDTFLAGTLLVLGGRETVKPSLAARSRVSATSKISRGLS
jgi:ADP-dependent phosphofructokinase/glucokinase